MNAFCFIKKEKALQIVLIFLISPQSSENLGLKPSLTHGQLLGTTDLQNKVKVLGITCETQKWPKGNFCEAKCNYLWFIICILKIPSSMPLWVVTSFSVILLNSHPLLTASSYALFIIIMVVLQFIINFSFVLSFITAETCIPFIFLPCVIVSILMLFTLWTETISCIY